MSIPQRHREPLERFQAAVDGRGAIYESLQDSRPMYRWCCQVFADCQQVMAVLWPYLCSIKRAQWEAKSGAFLAQWEGRGHSGKGYQNMTKDERAAYQREWRKRNPDKQAEYQRNYRVNQQAML
jgi:hypothetical protein